MQAGLRVGISKGLICLTFVFYTTAAFQLLKYCTSRTMAFAGMIDVILKSEKRIRKMVSLATVLVRPLQACTPLRTHARAGVEGPSRSIILSKNDEIDPDSGVLQVA